MTRLLLLLGVSLCLFSNIGEAQISACGVASDEPPGCFLCGPVYFGSTANYTQGSPGAVFPCGTIENNQWLSFIASSSTVAATIYADSCVNEEGVQLLIYDPNLNPVSTCFSSPGANIPGNVIANGLTPGDVYWIMIDGFAGDICNFNLSIVGGVATGPPNPPGSIQPIPNSSSLCPGMEVCYSISPVLNAVAYEWELSQDAIITSGGGVNDIKVCIRYIDPGIKTICVTPYNACYGGTSVCINTEIRDNPPVHLPSFEIMPGDYPVEIDGHSFPGPGLYSFTNPSASGCDSTVVYEILTCEGVHGSLDTTICAGTTLQIGNEIYSEAGAYTATLPAQGSGGCDSIINLNLTIYEDVMINSYTDAILCPEPCTDLSVDAGFSNPTEFEYTWSTPDGNITGPMESLTTTVCGPGTYQLVFINTLSGNSCSVQTVIPELQELSDLSEITFEPMGHCPNTPVIFETDFLSNTDRYEWTLPARVRAIGNADSATVVLSFERTGNYNICVRALNSCDTSNTVCVDFQVGAPSSADFEVVEKACVGDISTIIYTGSATPSATFNWNFDGGTIISGSGQGPFEVQWDSDGNYLVFLQIEENGCLSQPQTQLVQVLQPVEAPEVSCTSSDSTIQFDWNYVTGAVGYEIRIDGANQIVTAGNSYTIEGLTSDTSFTIEVKPISSLNSTCTPPVVTATCHTACPPIGFEAPSDTVLCYDEQELVLPLFDVDGACYWTGPGVSPDCRFDPNLAMPGDNMLQWEYQQDNCIYKDSVNVIVIRPSAFSAEVLPPIWHDGTNGLIDITMDGNQPVLFQWSDGSGEEDLLTTPGTYCVTISDEEERCPASDCFTVPQGIFRTTQIIVLCQGEAKLLKVRPQRGVDFNWSPANGLSCTECSTPLASPVQTTVYSITATLPGGRSGSTNVFVLVLPPPFCPNSFSENNAWRQKAAEELRKFGDFKNKSENDLIKLLDNSLAPGESTFHIYPNPFKTNITVEGSSEKEAQIEIYNLSGKLLSIHKIESAENVINLEHLARGTYFVRIKTAFTTSVEKVIKL